MSDSNPGEGERSFNAVAKPQLEGASPPVEDPKPHRSRLGMPVGAFGFFVLLLLAAACGGLIAVYWPWVTGNGGDTSAVAERLGALESRVGQIAAGQAPSAAAASFAETQRNLAALKTRVDADEARLAAVETAAPKGGSVDTGALKTAIEKNTADLAQLAIKIESDEKVLAGSRSELDAQAKANAELLSKLDGRIGVLEKNAPPADLSERLDSFALKTGMATLEARIGRLEDQDTAGLVRQAASLLALADLVRATGREQPFDNELRALRALTPASPDVADLAKYARTGVPTTTSLAARFHHDIDSVLAAERASRAKNWMERVWYDAVNLVSVRRVGNVSGTDTEARAARAEFALKNGDLAAAVAEVRAFDKPAKAAIASWLRDATARLAVDRDATALTNRIVSGFAKTPEAEAPPAPHADAPQ